MGGGEGADQRGEVYVGEGSREGRWDGEDGGDDVEGVVAVGEG